MKFLITTREEIERGEYEYNQQEIFADSVLDALYFACSFLKLENIYLIQII